MAILKRITFVAHGRLAMREIRLEAARRCRHGVQVTTFEQMAARLAGGFLEPIDADALRIAVRQALPVTDLGGLDGIKDLPGMSDAACETLRKVWRSGIDLTARAGDHPRLGSIRRLEEAVVARLPPSMMRPADLAVAAGRRLEHARALFGAIDDDATPVEVADQRPVARPLAPSPVVDPDSPRTLGRREARESTDGSQQRVPTDWKHQPAGEPRGWSAAERQPAMVHDDVEALPAARERGYAATGHALREDAAATGDLDAPKPSHADLDCHLKPMRREIGDEPPVAAVHAVRSTSAGRTRRSRQSASRRDHHVAADAPDRIDAQALRNEAGNRSRHQGSLWKTARLIRNCTEIESEPLCRPKHSPRVAGGAAQAGSGRA